MKQGRAFGELRHFGDSHRQARPASGLGRFAARAALACQVACDVLEEAVEASHMVRSGCSLDRIRAEIDRKYGR